jgi:hypothetical protein
MRNPDFRRGVAGYFSDCSSRCSSRSLALAAAVFLILSAMSERAEALSPINPGTAAANKVAASGLAIEVRGGHGGNGGYSGSFHSGGATAFHNGALRSGPAYVGGGAGFGGHRFAHRHHFRRVLVGGVYYDYPYDYPYDDYPYYAGAGCRVVLTGDGPRRVCNVRPWRHHYHGRHQPRRHHRVYR